MNDVIRKQQRYRSRTDGNKLFMSMYDVDDSDDDVIYLPAPK